MSRYSVTPFRRGKWYWARIPRIGKAGRQRSLGVNSRDVAQLICAMLETLRGRRESFLLDELAEKRVGFGPVLDAFNESRLDQFIKDLREGRADEDLEPYVAKWQAEMARIGKPTAPTRAKYLGQVRTFLPERIARPRSTFTKRTVRTWLAGLGVASTNRYRAALSSFAEYLVEEEVIAFNPVRQVKAIVEPDPRLRYLDQDEARRLLAAITDARARAYQALAAATGMERQALGRLLRRDIDMSARTAYARGTKKKHRQRTVSVYSRWEWAFDHVAKYLASHPMLPDAKVFAGLSHDVAYRALKDACKAIGVEDYTTHDWRHTWSVQALRDGVSINTIAHQLGHVDPVMTLQVYGRFRPTGSDFGTLSATYSATITEAANVK